MPFLPAILSFQRSRWIILVVCSLGGLAIAFGCANSALAKCLQPTRPPTSFSSLRMTSLDRPGVFWKQLLRDTEPRSHVQAGSRLTNAYAACPVCSPTRASILTGLWPQRTGITDYIGAAQPGSWKRNTHLLPAPYRERLDHSFLSMAELLKGSGYATFFAGNGIWALRVFGPRIKASTSIEAASTKEVPTEVASTSLPMATHGLQMVLKGNIFPIDLPPKPPASSRPTKRSLSSCTSPFTRSTHP